MNQKTHYALSFYHLTLAIRDTLEYVQNRQTYSLQTFNAKKNTFELAMKENSPFIGFCANNGEIGEKLKTQLQEMYDTVYGENKTFISVEGEQVVPDHAQNLLVLDYILPLRQSLCNILHAYIEDQRKDGSLEPGIEEIVDLEDNFYRVIVSMVISDLLFNFHFVEFNKAMRESNGKETPQSNFCVNDIKKVLGMYNFIKQNTNMDKFVEFKACADKMDFGINLMTAQAKVPEGSSFKQEFDEIIKSWYEVVAKLEPVWRNKHQVVWKALVDYEQNQMNQTQDASKTN